MEITVPNPKDLRRSDTRINCPRPIFQFFGVNCSLIYPFRLLEAFGIIVIVHISPKDSIWTWAICAGCHSSLDFLVGGQSYSNILASTVLEAPGTQEANTGHFPKHYHLPCLSRWSARRAPPCWRGFESVRYRPEDLRWRVHSSKIWSYWVSNTKPSMSLLERYTTAFGQ